MQKEKLVTRRHWTAFIGVDDFHTRLHEVKQKMPKHYMGILIYNHPELKDSIKRVQSIMSHGYPKDAKILTALEDTF